jgi:hypothetical protein
MIVIHTTQDVFVMPGKVEDASLFINTWISERRSNGVITFAPRDGVESKIGAIAASDIRRIEYIADVPMDVKLVLGDKTGRAS